MCLIAGNRLGKLFRQLIELCKLSSLKRNMLSVTEQKFLILLSLLSQLDSLP